LAQGVDYVSSKISKQLLGNYMHEKNGGVPVWKT
jgi:hypothetical protein